MMDGHTSISRGLGAASHLVVPALCAISRLQSEWETVPAGDLTAAHAIEREVSAIAFACCDPSELRQRAEEARTAEEYLDAVLFGRQTDSADELFQQGTLAESRFLYQSAFDAYLAASQAAPSNLAFANAAGRTAYRLGHLEKAAHLFGTAPKAAFLNAALPVRTAFLSNYASTLRACGATDRAEKLLREAQRQVERPGVELPEQYSMILNNLGAILVSRNEFEAADKIYQKAISIRQRIGREDDLGLAQIQNNYAELMRRVGAIREAKSTHSRALKTRLRVLGPLSLAACESFNNLGAIAYDEGDYVNSDQCFKSAVDITGALLGRRHLQFGLTLNNVGMLLAKRGELEVALVYLRKAAKIVSASVAAQSPKALAIERNLMNIDIAAAKGRVVGNVVSNSIVIGPLSQSILTSSESAAGTSPRQEVVGSTIHGHALLASNVASHQRVADSSAVSLDMVINSKEGRKAFCDALERAISSIDQGESARHRGSAPPVSALRSFVSRFRLKKQKGSLT